MENLLCGAIDGRLDIARRAFSSQPEAIAIARARRSGTGGVAVYIANPVKLMKIW